MCDAMSFPATVDEFMEQYKIVDREEVYTNGAEMVPIFRMKQWFEHEALGKDTNVPTKWIPFKTRPLTEEEKEEYPEWDYILDCKLPNDGQRILVNIKYKSHEAVQMDEFYTDDGCYLDSGYEIGTEATAWMPLPEPYKDE